MFIFFPKAKFKILFFLVLVSVFFLATFNFHKKTPKNLEVCSLSDFGAIGDGQTSNTKVFQEAIQKCNKIIVSKGTYKTGAIWLDSNTELHIQKDAEIIFSEEKNEYPLVKTRWAGLDLINYSPFIYANNCQNIKITGEGKINGNGREWQRMIENQKKDVKKLYQMSLDEIPIEKRIFKNSNLRPSLIQPYNCQDVLIEGIEIIEGAMWTVHPVYSENVTIKNITIKTEGSNTDGIVIDSTKNVLIENVNITSGDDAIAIKSGRDKDGWTQKKPSENIQIKNVQIYDAHGGLTIGSEMSGNVKNVSLEKMIIHHADRGIRLKTLEGRGGKIENIHIKDVLIKNTNLEAIKLDMAYGSSTMKPKTKKKPQVNNFTIENITIENSQERVVSIDGIQGQMNNILLKNIFTDNKKIIRIKNGDNILLENVNLQKEIIN